MEIRRKRGNFKDMGFRVNLGGYGKTSSDVAEIYFSVKVKETDADDSLLLKKYTTAGITYTGTDLLIVKVKWAVADYNNLIVGKRYKAGLFLKFSGDPEADENVSQIFDLVIYQDFLIS